jgi:hypothetical protein
VNVAALERCAYAERADVERAAEVDERLVVAGCAGLLRKRNSAVRRLCGCQSGLLEDRLRCTSARSRAMRSSVMSRAKYGSVGYVASHLLDVEYLDNERLSSELS